MATHSRASEGAFGDHGLISERGGREALVWLVLRKATNSLLRIRWIAARLIDRRTAFPFLDSKTGSVIALKTGDQQELHP